MSGVELDLWVENLINELEVYNETIEADGDYDYEPAVLLDSSYSRGDDNYSIVE